MFVIVDPQYFFDKEIVVENFIIQNKNAMEAEQDRSVKKHQAQQLGFNSLQVVLSVAMVAVGTSASILMELNL